MTVLTSNHKKNTHMKKILILLLAITLLSCSKDEIEDEIIDEIEAQDYSSFLRVRTPRFMGQLNSQHIDWRYGWGQFQMSTGSYIQYEIYSETSPLDILNFGLSNDDGTSQLTFLSPSMDTSDQAEVSRVLDNGVKQIGEISKDFYISLRINNNLYKHDPNTTGELEILKTEEIEDSFDGKTLLVWIKIDHLSLKNSNDKNLELKNGLLVAKLVIAELE